MTIYKYVCKHNLPETIEISVEAEDEEDGLELATDEFFTHFESNAGIELTSSLTLVPTNE